MGVKRISENYKKHQKYYFICKYNMVEGLSTQAVILSRIKDVEDFVNYHVTETDRRFSQIDDKLDKIYKAIKEPQE